ncbi:MAG: cardiolipin synthase [Candidatus Competibacteraceae bacterium]|nr:cardiolipin synthase [Candidatus Competibacteraceae bacterium]MCB1813834.1 cardiolipin synthase [Candidatus Competibacteraceae bacterium]
MSLEGLLVLLIHAVIGPAAVFHALLYKRDSRSALGWIGFCLFFPLVGPLIYAVFGVNRVHTRARELKPPAHRSRLIAYELGETAASVTGQYQGIVNVGYCITGQPPRAGNAVQMLCNGEQIYPAMQTAIKQARHSIHLASYIFDTDQVGREFIALLQERVRAGVAVRVIVDGVGECYSWPRASKLLRRAGVPVAQFMPVRLLPPSLSINLRSHRKILVVDEQIGFTGGANIGSRHLVQDTSSKKRVADIHFRLQGPIAKDLNRLFLEDWRFLTGETVAASEPRAVPLESQGAQCRLISDGPNEDMDRLVMLYLGVISSAQQRISIMTPYFLPERELAAALRAAVLRGVEVRIVLPGQNNLPFVHWASQHMLGELLHWGVRVFYQPPPFVHSKLLLVDDDYSLIGSANLDARSLRLNFELGVEIFEHRLSQKLYAHFEQALARSREATMQDVLQRTVWQRARDASMALFAPYM